MQQGLPSAGRKGYVSQLKNGGRCLARLISFIVCTGDGCAGHETKLVSLVRGQVKVKAQDEERKYRQEGSRMKVCL